MVIVLRCVSMAFSCATSGAAATIAVQRARVLRRIRINVPQIPLEDFGRKHACYHLAPRRNERVLPLPDLPHQKGALLYMTSSAAAQGLIAAESQLRSRLFTK